ncbi:MAG: hypothetical protein ACR2F1_06345 [Nitrososphaeraceae archaeon]
MEEIVENFAQRLEISPDMARQGISITSRFFLQNSEPVVATGILSMLPSSLTNMFSNDEKQEFKTSQKYTPYDEIIKKISNDCFNGDIQKAKKVYEEAINVIKRQIW